MSKRLRVQTSDVDENTYEQLHLISIPARWTELTDEEKQVIERLIAVLLAERGIAQKVNPV